MVCVFDLFGIGTALSGLLGFVGQERTNSSNELIASNNNAFNANQAQIGRDYMTSMSNTAHTREVADLKNAGLNPILSQNAGASTPGGGSASSSGNPTMQNSMGAVSAALDLYLRGSSVTAQNDLVRAQTEKIRTMLPAEKSQTEQNTKTSKSQEILNRQSGTIRSPEATIMKKIGGFIDRLTSPTRDSNTNNFNSPQTDYGPSDYGPLRP